MPRRRPLPRRIPRLRESQDTEDKLNHHGLTVEQAHDVARLQPVLVPQAAKVVLKFDGTIYEQPARLKIIGPDRSGRMLTIVVEYPDKDNQSVIVTGYPSRAGDQTQFRQRTGGRP